MRACHWKAQSDQSDKWHHQSRTATFHWTNHEGWTMSHHFSCHEHRKQSPRQKGGHRKEDTGTHINLKGRKHALNQVLSILSDHFPTVILLYIDLTPYILCNHWKNGTIITSQNSSAICFTTNFTCKDQSTTSSLVKTCLRTDWYSQNNLLSILWKICSYKISNLLLRNGF